MNRSGNIDTIDYLLQMKNRNIVERWNLSVGVKTYSEFVLALFIGTHKPKRPVLIRQAQLNRVK